MNHVQRKKIDFSQLVTLEITSWAMKKFTLAMNEILFLKNKGNQLLYHCFLPIIKGLNLEYIFFPKKI